MARAPVGHSIDEGDIPTILGMLARGDAEHNIAAWFGVNQGRIAEAKDGKWGKPAAAKPEDLPPKGAPGLKGRRLRDAVARAVEKLAQDPEGAAADLRRALVHYNQPEA